MATFTVYCKVIECVTTAKSLSFAVVYLKVPRNTHFQTSFSGMVFFLLPVSDNEIKYQLIMK